MSYPTTTKSGTEAAREIKSITNFVIDRLRYNGVTDAQISSNRKKIEDFSNKALKDTFVSSLRVKGWFHASKLTELAVQKACQEFYKSTNIKMKRKSKSKKK